MALTYSFPLPVRENASRRPLDKLGRAGAVRQRKEEVHEMNGHTFVAKRFYNIMRCALCGEFMVNNGYQCEGKLCSLIPMICFFISFFIEHANNFPSSPVYRLRAFLS
jgi:hypothetical protein